MPIVEKGVATVDMKGASMTDYNRVCQEGGYPVDKVSLRDLLECLSERLRGVERADSDTAR